MGQTEQLLRRMTGSITEYVNTVGMRPLRMSDFDKAVLAIQDGELDAFMKYAAKVPYQQEETLLVEAAGRPGGRGPENDGAADAGPMQYRLCFTMALSYPYKKFGSMGIFQIRS